MTTIDALRAYGLAFPGATESMPFGPDVLTFNVGGKLFALLSLNEQPLRINLKCPPEHATELRAQWPGHILPGYHMNKRHWNTLVLDGQLPPELLREQIQLSYERVVQGLPRAKRDALPS